MKLRCSENQIDPGRAAETAVQICVIPAAKTKKLEPSEFSLYAANGSEIKTYRSKLLTIDLGLKRKIEWSFIVAEVSKGISGADFLHHFGLFKDLKNQKLIDNITKLKISGEVTAVDANDSVCSLYTKCQYSKMLEKFSELTKPSIIPKVLRHKVQHYITTSSGPPVYSKARRLDPHKLQIAKKEFQFLLNIGILRPLQSQWASPLYLVMKSNGQWRVCEDYRSSESPKQHMSFKQLNQYGLVINIAKSVFGVQELTF
ncbi:uncharacterized protein LOC124805614 [Schistocerca piceifrons]|uniref:uncharacterized protein LOC124805614 n=1 Tax=Schistocerca piceifrons TaxID=274613 RepID=UPI001F5EAFC8|nr:uncharacterized protein LOC124805614 [Schistocerca piceifrons]